MARIGYCGPPDLSIPVSRIAGSGAEAFRWTARPDVDDTAFIADLMDAGIQPIVTFDRDSFTADEEGLHINATSLRYKPFASTDDFTMRLWLSTGNEFDGEGAESWQQTPEECNAIGRAS